MEMFSFSPLTCCLLRPCQLSLRPLPTPVGSYILSSPIPVYPQVLQPHHCLSPGPPVPSLSILSPSCRILVYPLSPPSPIPFLPLTFFTNPYPHSSLPCSSESTPSSIPCLTFTFPLLPSIFPLYYPSLPLVFPPPSLTSLLSISLSVSLPLGLSPHTLVLLPLLSFFPPPLPILYLSLSPSPPALLLLLIPSPV